MDEAEIDDHARHLVTTFALPSKVGRLNSLRSTDEKRATFRAGLGLLPFRSDRTTRLSHADSSPAAVLTRLRDLGAGERCVVFEESREWAGTLDDAVAAVVGLGYGAVISGLPGRLGYAESESGERLVLSLEE
jgi:hypothetical protein